MNTRSQKTVASFLLAAAVTCVAPLAASAQEPPAPVAPQVVTTLQRNPNVVRQVREAVRVTPRAQALRAIMR